MITSTGRRLRRARLSDPIHRATGQLISDALIERAEYYESLAHDETPNAPGLTLAAADLREQAFFIRRDVGIESPLEPIL